MTILDNVKQLCEEHDNLSINRLEKEAEMTRGSLAKWDTTSPGIDKLVKVANYFHVSVVRLLDGTKYEQPADTMADGLNDLQKELIELVAHLTEDEALVLLAGAKAQLSLRKSRDDS